MKNLKILFADEDQKTLDEYKKLFTEDYEIVGSSSDGLQTINLIKNTNPDIVVMDIVLQNCDGFKVLENIDTSKTKVVIHSSLSMDGFINKAISMGAKYYCIKPFDLQTLKDRVKDILTPQQTNKSKEIFNTKSTNQIEEKITNIFITVVITFDSTYNWCCIVVLRNFPSA